MLTGGCSRPRAVAAWFARYKSSPEQQELLKRWEADFAALGRKLPAGYDDRNEVARFDTMLLVQLKDEGRFDGEVSEEDFRRMDHAQRIEFYKGNVDAMNDQHRGV